MASDRSRSSSTTSEDLGPFRSVEIGAAFPHFPKKEMTRESPIESPGLRRRNDLIHMNNGHEQAIPSQILKLKEHHQMQQQILLQHFQEEQQRLAARHDLQLRQRLEEWYAEQQQRQREEEDRQRLECLKKKDKHEQSAVPSEEVKRKLQGFLLNRLKSSTGGSNGISGPSPQGYHSCSVLPSASPDSSSTANVAGTNPLQHPLPGKSEKTFPLRKTASEPNIPKNKIMNKQHVRFSPLAQTGHLRDLHHRKKLLAMSNNCESGPNSPPIILSSSHVSPAGHNTPIAEENEPTYGKLTANEQNGSLSDLSSLYSSPSMPNISLGRPPTASEGSKLATVSEAEVRAACAAKLGVPLTGHMLSGTIPFFPTLAAIDSDYHNSSSSNIHKPTQSLEQSRPSYPILYHPSTQPITDSQVALARLTKQGHRPLGRTQSAPLPLGHPLLATGHNLGVHYEDCQQPLTAHNFLKQQIRQTIITRAGSRVHSSSNSTMIESLENDSAEVIDLTDKKCDRVSNDETEMTRQRRERENILHQQQQRDFMMRHTLQISEGSAFSPRSSRPLSRTLSSPLVALGNETSSSFMFSSPKMLRSSQGQRTGLCWDSLMLKHGCTCGNNAEHAEHGGRLQSVWARLGEKGLIERCDRIRSRKATLEELQVCHSEPHALLLGTNSYSRQKLEPSKLAQLPTRSFVLLPCGGLGVDSDTTWNDLHTASAARMAAGCVIELAAKSELHVERFAIYS